MSWAVLVQENESKKVKQLVAYDSNSCGDQDQDEPSSIPLKKLDHYLKLPITGFFICTLLDDDGFTAERPPYH